MIKHHYPDCKLNGRTIHESSITTNLFMQLLSAGVQSTIPVIVEERPAQVFVSILFLSKYAEYLFSLNPYCRFSSTIPLIGFGEYTSQDVVEATEKNSRIINYATASIEGPKKVHAATDGLSFANALHDMFHWGCVTIISTNKKDWIINFFHKIQEVTDKRNSRWIFNLADLEATFPDLYHDNDMISLQGLRDFIALLLRTRFSTLIKGVNSEFLFIEIFATLLEPGRAEILFSDHRKQAGFLDDRNDFFQERIVGRSDIATNNLSQIKANFKSEYSITLNIFFYLLNEAVSDGKLSEDKRRSLLSLAVPLEKNVFVWTQNSGLKIKILSGVVETSVFVRDITNENCDNLISILVSWSREKNISPLEPEQVAYILQSQHCIKNNPSIPQIRDVARLLVLPPPNTHDEDLPHDKVVIVKTKKIQP